MRREPGFTTAIVLSLALGIGATTAIFSLINTLLLSPMPFENEESIVRLRDILERPGQSPRLVGMSSQNAYHLQEESLSFLEISAQDYTSFNLVSDGEPLRVQGGLVSHELFGVLGVEPLLGRAIQEDDDRPGAATQVAMIGYDLWQRQFGGGEDVLGQDVILNDQPHTIIGVMPRFFRFPYDAEVWVPLGLTRDASAPARHYLNVLGRLKPGIDREKAQQELDLMSQQLAEAQPDTHAGWRMLIVPLREDLSDDLQPRLFLSLLAATGFLLLIACANVASMLLSRSLKARGELATRVALGASRGRLVQQLVTQGVVLALISAVVGTLAAFAVLGPMVALSPLASMNQVFQDVTLDLRVLGFAFGVSIVVGILFSLAPALMVLRPNLQGFLREGSRSTVSPTSRRILTGFVVVEVAVAVMLLVGAGLMVRSFQKLLDVDVGYAKENRLVLRLSLSPTKYPDDIQKGAFVKRALENIQSLSGVASAAATSTHPLDDARVGTLYSVEGRPPASADEMLIANHRFVSPGYLKTLGATLLEGRGIEERDRENTAPVVVISKTFADEHWPGESAVGQRVKRGRYDSEQPWIEVVGVVGDVDDRGSFEKTWYLAKEQRYSALPNDDFTFVVETQGGEPMAALSGVRQKILEVDGEQPIWGIYTASQEIENNYREENFSARLFTLFAAVGLALAVLGIYGILSYTVAQQTQEIGLRLVLGAQPGDLLRLILMKGLWLGACGVALGLLGVVALTRFLESLLYGISPTDPPTLIMISVLILAVTLVASFIPARRAMGIKPMSALRYE